MIYVEGQGRCKCRRIINIHASVFPYEHRCVCGLVSMIHRCTGCGDIEIIYESARHKFVACGNCGQTIQEGVVKATKETVGTVVETDYRQIGPERPYGSIQETSRQTPQTHRRVESNSVSGPHYAGDKKATCWGGNRYMGQRKGPRRR